MSDKLPLQILLIENDQNKSAGLLNITEKSLFNITRTDKLTNLPNLMNKPDLIVLSISHSDLGSAFEESLKEVNSSQIPMILSLDEPVDIKQYTELSKYNVVDFIIRPHSEDKFMSTIISLINKSKIILKDRVIIHKNIKMDITNARVYYMDKLIKCSLTEFNILKLFVQFPHNIFSRKDIINSLWHSDNIVSERTIDVHINRIRKTLKLVNRQHYNVIKTVRSAGYCLEIV